MGVPFDHIASSYDSSFTRTPIGQLQRKQVWGYLEKITTQLPGLDILELNCGTGEDAVLFSEKGFNIVATDVSEEMLKVTQEKVQQYSMQHKISSHYLDLDSFDDTLFQKKFDLVFSNFGGLNCINPESLQKLFDKIPAVLSPEGRFVAVIMPKFCLWESVYFFLKISIQEYFQKMDNEKRRCRPSWRVGKDLVLQPFTNKVMGSEVFYCEFKTNRPGVTTVISSEVLFEAQTFLGQTKWSRKKIEFLVLIVRDGRSLFN